MVTGGNRRIGAEIVRYLSSRGAELVVHSRTDSAEARELLRQLPGTGHRLVVADLRDDAALADLCDAACDCQGMVLNASLYRHGYNGGDPAFDAELAKVNHLAPLELLRRWSKERAAQSAVAVLDQAILGAAPPFDPYLASRRALWLDMLALARSIGRIRFNAVAPGPMLPPAELPDSRMERTVETLPLRRRVEPADLAGSIAWLLSCESLTGTLLPVDCGQSLARRDF